MVWKMKSKMAHLGLEIPNHMQGAMIRPISWGFIENT